MIKFCDVLFGIVAPLALVPHFLAHFVAQDIVQPFGVTRWWVVVGYWLLPVWIVLIFLGPPWAWLTRRNPAETFWRHVVQSDSVRVRVVIGLIFAAAVAISANIGPDLARLSDDFRNGPVAEEGVVCRYPVWARGGEAVVTLEFADGNELRMSVFAELRDLRMGVGQRLVQRCKSNEPFTLTWWPATKVIADVQ